MRMRIAIDAVSFDWNVAGSGLTRFIFSNIMDGLMGLDSKLAPVPALARNVALSSDGLKYTFTLREGVKWSDGQPLTATDFVTSWKRLLDPLDAKSYALFLRNVVNAEAFSSGKLRNFAAVGIKALAPGRLEVTLNRPQADFLHVLTLPALFPLRQDLLDREGRSWHLPGKILTLGPFIPVTHEAGKRIVLKRNPLYYGTPPKLALIDISVLDEDAKAVAKFKAGEFDFAIPLNFTEAALARKLPAFHLAPQFRTRTLFLNVTKYPLNLRPVRQAIRLALDREALSRYFQGIYVPAELWVSHELLGPKPADAEPDEPGFDIAKAKALLKEAGVDPTTVGKLELHALSTDESALVSGFVAQALKTNLGFTIDLKLAPRDRLIQNVTLGEGHLTIYSRPADYPDAYPVLATLVSGAKANTTGWKNPSYDALIHLIEGKPLGPARGKYIREALNLALTREVPVIPLYSESYGYLVSPSVRGLEINAMGDISLRSASLVP